MLTGSARPAIASTALAPRRLNHATSIPSPGGGGGPGRGQKPVRACGRILATALLLIFSSIQAAEFEIVNNDDPGVGLNDPTEVAPVGVNPETTLGAQRLFALQAITEFWGAELASDVTIRVGVTFESIGDVDNKCTTDGGVLGFAGPARILANFSNATFADTWHHVALANALAAEDLRPEEVDINVTINSDVDEGCLGVGTSFYYGIDGNPPDGTVDIVPLMLHELAHGLGFSNFVDLETGEKAGGSDDVFMRNIADVSSGTLFWPDMTNEQRAASAINDPNVVWTGEAVAARAASVVDAAGAFNAGFLRLHAPDPLVDGSSISHWTSDASPDLLMEPSLSRDLEFGGLDLTVDLFRDIGWPTAVLFADGFETNSAAGSP